jgi:MFS family permease
MRRLLVLASLIVFVDVAFFAAITPLLPAYVEELGLSRGEAGILTASYAAGTLLASLPAGLLAMRIGPRAAVLAGLALLGLASLGFGFADSAIALDAARFGQGVGSALTWAGALSWLIDAAPADRRGELIGTAFGAAVAGALLGPVIGGLADRVGTEPVFGSVLVLAFLLGLLALRVPAPPRAPRPARPLAGILEPPVLRGAGLLFMPSLLFGAVAVLIPLRIDELGGSAAVVAAGFTAGAALETVLSPLVGRFSDRRGRRAPITAGLLCCSAGILAVPLAGAVGVVLAALIVISVGAGLSFSPAMAALSDGAEAVGLSQAVAAGLLNMAWAAGQMSGAAGGGAAAEAFGYGVPCVALAAAMAAVALKVAPRRGGGRFAPGAGRPPAPGRESP